ncbi:hypothetical protein F2P56_014467 [Juglans regia]|uniref:Glycosyl transferase family 1 domain-containing protein n=2 Tax=Juglans regia TaxID=51240 RepID=A0A834CSE1_JUGRE|nr:uncharacterized protein LOC109004168 isoform X2 [Juglans regia]KAF5464390.1 hypothetical protein F2P56_014467 [Juglans regia]
MGSLEVGIPLKRDSLFRSYSAGRTERHQFLQRHRSRFSRFLIFKKLDYLLWICTVTVFLFLVALFQMYLPGSVVEKSGASLGEDMEVSYADFKVLKEMGVIDFAEDVRFEPTKVLEKFQKEARAASQYFSASNRTVHRFGYRKPQLALVFADLFVDSQQLLMVTVAAALQEIGYKIQVFSLEDGPVREIWRKIGIPITIIQTCVKMPIVVDWLNYDGILVSSFQAQGVFSCFEQEPFKSLPLIWTIHERLLATRSRKYISDGQTGILSDWKRVFNRSTVVVFPNYVLPMIYSTFDVGNFFVIPGSPAEAWEADTVMASHKDNLHFRMGYEPEYAVIAIVGSQFLYKSLWLEHAIILQALLPVVLEFPLDNSSNSQLKIIVLSGDSTSNYGAVIEEIALKLKYQSGIVKHKALDVDADSVLSMADLVIYGSFLEEQSFPDILMKAMCFEKPIIAPDLSMIKKYVDDRVNGYLFPKENTKVLTQMIRQVFLKGKISPLARNIASIGRSTARNLMVLETVEGYASLLLNVLKLPSEVASPGDVAEIPPKFKEKWQWHLFEVASNSTYTNRTLRGHTFLDKFEQHWNHTQRERSGDVKAANELFVYNIWEEEKEIAMSNARKGREEEEIKGRTDQSHGTWEEVYRSAKKADRSKNDLHEREEGELERTGQPLCIYEPYFGEGTWPFLHVSSLYRGIGLSTKGRRPRAEDVDAPSRLPLLNNPYYRDILGEYGAFFAIANSIDRVHKNAWIGFQSWRATASKASLSRIAENALLDAIQSRRHGDALYFWVRLDLDPRNPLQLDFWSFCDAINAGNCKLAFSEALKRMYGIKHDLDSLPSMPVDGGTWSVMHSWALPTRSFLEFVMFSRMFVDALDAHMYDKHHSSGHCYLSLFKDKHCYSRILELLINVWAYHSARRMMYVNPKTGEMQEHHRFKSRKGQMWIRWFSFATLKSMDEDMAEEADTENRTRRWLWPLTGEVFWQGVYERERALRHQQKETRKRKSKEKIDRMRKRTHQKEIGKYVKPLPESNSTVVR